VVKQIKKKNDFGLVAWIFLGLIVVVILFFALRGIPENKSMPDNKGTLAIHIHPKLFITINGKPYPIPRNIGVTIGNVIDTQLSGMDMSPVHTHEDASQGIIHVESLVRRDFTLGYFFRVWGKTFNSQCIFDYCSGNGKVLKMFVDGKESNEFENHVFKDGEKIEIIYG
jgi:hypothetical protein